MLDWLRAHSRVTDLGVVGIAVGVSVSLTDELGLPTALALGLGVILIVNLVLRARSPGA
jgi:uncharacterized protein (DUF2062 family)